jgi:hypothetical protein
MQHTLQALFTCTSADRLRTSADQLRTSADRLRVLIGYV